MSVDFDVIIVGAGLAGCTSAYLLAQAGLETLVIERGNFPGAKNMTGGRLYGHSLEKIFPNFAEEAPVERCIVHEKISFMDGEDSTTLEYASPKSEDPADRSYSVLRSKFDQWLADKAESAGASIVPGIRVDDLIVRDGKVCGVVASGEEMEAHTVILADGVNSILAEKLGMETKVSPHTGAVGVKEVIQLSKQQINDRFGCTDDDGAAWLFAGTPSNGHMGGGFIYTNEDTLSLGLVFGLHNIDKTDKSVPQMLEDFKDHPTVKPLLEGGKLIEYSAHVVPEGGYDMIPKLVGDGVLVAGDAAGLCLNVGFTVRGMDLAIASGEAAAKAVIAAKNNGDFSESGLSSYKTELENSFVMKDMKLYQKLPRFLDNPRMYNEYPNMVTGIMKDIFTINGTSVPLRKIITPHLKQVGFMNLLKDGFKGAKAI
ncbi:FAD-dependent oxidoreductase [Pseudodesulfovibrio sp. JC047]|uniref:FAD-dependent oxidoreductase FixC n=1 Tax=Pseudodesulfovibrio sp. JC047 TaxID=2683199 RepID=UPI0013CFD11C|nr:FAD-dependent oxidoreductase FixC [Pseudodesulfovibrio sp. JC047]NDV18396.1 FAD-dependent oxidoreductase [Pseudodesulfovibrio sp. JC047]